MHTISQPITKSNDVQNDSQQINGLIRREPLNYETYLVQEASLLKNYEHESVEIHYLNLAIFAISISLP